MSRTKVAIYSCYVPFNEETKLLNEEKIRDVQRQLSFDEIVGIFEDICTAATPLEERPELKKLLEMAERKEIEEIAVTQVKRLAKSMELMIDIFNKFRKAGVTIKCFEEGINNNRPYCSDVWEHVVKNLKIPEYNPNKNVKNVILYYRYESCSVESEEEHQRNIQECKGKIEEDTTLNLISTIIDRAIDDKSIMDRDGIKTLMGGCSTHNVDMVYTPSAETLAPVTRDFIRICQELEKLGVGVKIMDSELTIQCEEETNFTMM